MCTAPSTPETILARFAVAYAEHGAGDERRLRITYDNGNSLIGYIKPHGRRAGHFLLMTEKGYLKDYLYPKHIDRIDYSNARYRGTAPLWQREW